MTAPYGVAVYNMYIAVCSNSAVEDNIYNYCSSGAFDLSLGYATNSTHA